jgi:hypothetical protein
MATTYGTIAVDLAKVDIPSGDAHPGKRSRSPLADRALWDRTRVVDVDVNRPCPDRIRNDVALLSR